MDRHRTKATGVRIPDDWEPDIETVKAYLGMKRHGAVLKAMRVGLTGLVNQASKEKQ